MARFATLAATSLPPSTRLVLYAPTAEALVDARRRLPLDANILPAPLWAMALGLVTSASCLLVWVPRGSTFDAPRALLAARELLADIAVVCAHGEPGTRLELERTGAANETIALDASPPRVWSAVQGACIASLLSATAGRLRVAFLPEALRAALHRLCVDRPPTTLAELSAAIGVHRRTLWYQWRRTARRTRLRLEDVVTFVLLLRASILRCRGASWSAAAAAVGVHRHTIARAARRWWKYPLPAITVDLRPCAYDQLRQSFRDNVLCAVLSD